jgi:hypothetical protein
VLKETTYSSKNGKYKSEGTLKVKEKVRMQTSVGNDMGLERDRIIGFVRNMKPKDHLIFLYSNLEDKHFVLFTYLKTGLERGEATAYVASQETPQQIRRAMKEYGIDIERYELNGALRIIDYKDWYIIGGGFDPSVTLDHWKGLVEESKRRKFSGLRVLGEMSCFFDNEIVEDLMNYENSFKKNAMPIMTICAYDKSLFTRQAAGYDPTEVLIGLLAAHSTAIIMAPVEGVVKTI